MSVRESARLVAAAESSVDAGLPERAPAARQSERRPFTALRLAEAMTARGCRTSPREAHMHLVALEHSGVVALSDVPGMWIVTDKGAQLAAGIVNGELTSL